MLRGGEGRRDGEGEKTGEVEAKNLKGLHLPWPTCHDGVEQRAELDSPGWRSWRGDGEMSPNRGRRGSGGGRLNMHELSGVLGLDSPATAAVRQLHHRYKNLSDFAGYKHGACTNSSTRLRAVSPPHRAATPANTGQACLKFNRLQHRVQPITQAVQDTGKELLSDSDGEPLLIYTTTCTDQRQADMGDTDGTRDSLESTNQVPPPATHHVPLTSSFPACKNSRGTSTQWPSSASSSSASSSSLYEWSLSLVATCCHSLHPPWKKRMNPWISSAAVCIHGSVVRCSGRRRGLPVLSPRSLPSSIHPLRQLPVSVRPGVAAQPRLDGSSGLGASVPGTLLPRMLLPVLDHNTKPILRTAISACVRVSVRNKPGITSDNAAEPEEEKMCVRRRRVGLHECQMWGAGGGGPPPGPSGSY
ncbi:unnamed protein product [Pleuronectes platessa]|uniref:Uncharacterized protein n=1 Tax=Pleuronectes platessa TaxID=8262 RepID=A0A9N7VD95_PLEPL|nr:unnamed protein product [Pleuronectes platessa]